MNLDSVDLRIIELLNRNARLDLKEMARSLGVSGPTISRRIKRMEDEGLIKGYMVVVDDALLAAGMGKTVPTVEEMVQIAASEFNRLKSSLNAIFSSGSALILFHIGHGIGGDIGEKLIGESKLDRPYLCLGFVNILQARGWGKIEISVIDFENARGKILSDPPYGKTASGNEPVHHLIRGMIAGFLECIFDSKIHVVEEKCVSMGSDHCEFLFEVVK